MRHKLVLVGPAYPYRGGNALFMTSVYQILAPKYELEFVNFRVLYPQLLFPGTTQFDQSQHPIPKVPNRRVLHSYNPISWVKVGRLIGRLDPDLILMDWWHPYFGPCYWGVTTALPGPYRQRVVIITENVISHEANAVDTVLTRMGLRNARAFITLSEAVRDALQPFADHRPIFVAGPPIPDFYYDIGTVPSQLEARQHLGIPSDAEVLLFFGYVRRYKGLDVLIEALAIARQRRPRLRLLVAGEFYENEQKYREQIAALGLEPYVTVANQYIPNEAVGMYYRAADVVVLPYREATQSGILATAYTFQRPVIATAVGGLQELVVEGKTGLIVPPEDPAALAGAIEQFFEIRASVDFDRYIQEFKEKQNPFLRFPSIVAQILEEIK